MLYRVSHASVVAQALVVCGSGIANMISRDTDIQATTGVAFHPPDVLVTPLLLDNLKYAGDSNLLPDSDVVLTLDGGGVKGYAQALILADLEERLGGPGTLLEHINVLGGTSIGGIVALALSIGKTAEECAAFLLEKAGSVFRESLPVAIFRNWVLGSSPWSEELARLLQDFLGSGDIPDRDQHRPRTFVMAQTGRSLKVISSGELLAAAKSTSALPFVFTAQTFEGAPVWDGGFGANNPVEFG